MGVNKAAMPEKEFEGQLTIPGTGKSFTMPQLEDLNAPPDCVPAKLSIARRKPAEQSAKAAKTRELKRPNRRGGFVCMRTLILGFLGKWKLGQQ